MCIIFWRGKKRRFFAKNACKINCLLVYKSDSQRANFAFGRFNVNNFVGGQPWPGNMYHEPNKRYENG